MSDNNLKSPIWFPVLLLLLGAGVSAYVLHNTWQTGTFVPAAATTALLIFSVSIAKIVNHRLTGD